MADTVFMSQNYFNELQFSDHTISVVALLQTNG